MRPFCFRFLLLLLAGGLVYGAYAQPEPQPPAHPGPLRFYHQQAENLNQTRAILQDHEGFMWFGQETGGGLFKYDGHTYTHFRNDPYDSLSLGAGLVNVLFEDQDRVLWVGKASGLSRFDRASETFRRYEHDPDDPASLSHNWVNDIIEDRQGTFWIATARGLNRMDRQAGTSGSSPGQAFTRFLVDTDSLLSPYNRMGPLLEDRDGTLWTGAWGLCRFGPQNGTFTCYLPYPSISEPGGDVAPNWVNAIHEDPKGRLWVGTWTGGLYLFDREAETFTNYRHNPALPLPIPGDDVREIVDDPAGGLWLATRREGLVWFDPETGATAAYRHDPWDLHSLSGNRVDALYRDRQGVFWVGTWWRDVDRFDRAARPFVYYGARPGGEEALMYSHVETVAEAPDGALWVLNGLLSANGEVVLTRIDRAAGTYRHFRHDPDDPGSLNENAFRVFVDRSGVVWIGGRGNVLSRMDPEHPGRFTHFRHDPGNATSLPPGRLRYIYEDTQGRLWVGLWNFGLSRMDDRERGVFTRFPLGEDHERIFVHHIFEDAAGMLWVGASGSGLFRFDPETGRHENYLQDPDHPGNLGGGIWSIWERPQEPGVLWLSIYPYGLGRFEPETGAFRLYTTEDGLPDNSAQGILGDAQGRLWIATDVGLSCFEPDTGVFTNYDVDDGLQGESFNAWAYHQGRSGQFYFGGPKGMNAFYPEEVRDNPHPPQVALTDLRLGREVVQPDEEGPLKQRLAETRALTLAHRQNDVTLSYVGLHFRHPEKNRYTHMLEGYDEAWSDTTTLRQATYTNLSPGEYTFRVKAANSDGVWNEEGASLKITILPPWWRTWWAYALYTLLLIGAIAQAYRWQHARIVRREQEKAHKVLEAAHKQLDASHHELQETHQHLKATQAQLIQAEKMASLGQLTAGIAHEIKNPLNFINNFAEVNEELADELRQDLAGHPSALATVENLLDDLKQNASVIAQHGKRADGIVKGMMQHASGSRGEREATDVNALVSEYVELAYHGKRATLPDLNVHIDRNLGADVGTVEMVPQEMGRVLLNLLGNAFDSVQEVGGARVRVSTRRVDGKVEIRVQDNGPGIPTEIKEKIFEPFFTTKPTGQGSTGLGLSLAYDIVTQGHGGALTVESTPGQGATFIVTLPCKAPAD